MTESDHSSDIETSTTEYNEGVNGESQEKHIYHNFQDYIRKLKPL